MQGKKEWYVVDGWRPSPQPAPDAGYEGHESIMILNPNPVDANVMINVYFEDRDPVENIPLVVPAKRIKSFKTHESDVLGGLELGVMAQYSMSFQSDVGIIVQYGRLDVQQPNMAYMALMGHSS